MPQPTSIPAQIVADMIFNASCGVPEVEPGALTSGDRWSVMIAACRCGCCT